MKKTVGVLTKDEYLFKKIELASREYAEVFRAEEGDGAERYDLFMVDTDAYSGYEGAFRLSRSSECDMAIPFSFSALEEAVNGAEGDPLAISEEEKCAYLYGKKISLTELEHALLLKLFSSEEYTTREELLTSLWPEGTGDGILNVYIHYLREKLEVGGEKIIVSSRKLGYKINEKYRKANRTC